MGETLTSVVRTLAPIGRRSRFDALRPEILAYGQMGKDTAEIHGLLLQMASSGEKRNVRDVPSTRTIQRYLEAGAAGHSQTEGDPAWSLAEAIDRNDAGLVLPMLQYLIHESRGKVTTIPANVARWITRICRLYPGEQQRTDRGGVQHPFAPSTMIRVADLWPFSEFRLFLLAADFARREPLGDTHDLDVYLALAPWREKAAAEMYLSMVKSGKLALPANLGWLGAISQNPSEDETVLAANDKAAPSSH